jgi:hypothetical protein
MMPQTISEMIALLQHHSLVLGLIEFGSDHQREHYAVGDYDLFVVLMHNDPVVRSLHFFVGSIPVDLNCITLDDLYHLTSTDDFRWIALLDGRILYDPAGVVAQAFAQVRHRQHQAFRNRLSENTVAMTRHWHRHVLDKIKGRLDTMPVFCRFLLSTNISKLIINYFRVRNLVFKGEKHAMEYLQQHEPALFTMLAAFYHTEDIARQVELTYEISNYVLAPVGGMWRDNEIVAFGTEGSTDLQARGYDLFYALFDRSIDRTEHQH